MIEWYSQPRCPLQKLCEAQLSTGGRVGLLAAVMLVLLGDTEAPAGFWHMHRHA